MATRFAVAAILLGALLLPAQGLGFAPTIPAVELAPAYVDGFRWDFSTWDRDLNHDRLDDLIPLVATHGIGALPRQADGFLPFSVRDGPTPLLDLHLAYEVGFGARDGAALASLGIRDYIADEVMPAAWAFGVTPQQAMRVADLPGVVMVEIEQVFRASNNVARQATQVDDSTTYTNGVWEDLGYTGDEIGIAILDTGVDDDHDFLKGRFVAGADAASVCGAGRALEVNPDDDATVTASPGVLVYHGTHVAGTALGHGHPTTGNAAGMAKEADLYDVKVLLGAGTSCLNSVSLGMNFVYIFNSGTSLTWQYPDSPLKVDSSKRIHIMSLSLGGACSDGSDSLSQSVNFMVNTVGVTAVIATGNDGIHPSSGAGCITSPSAATKAISVGAFADQDTVTRSDDVVASFSNCGPSVASPTSDQKKPDVTAPGYQIQSAFGGPTPNGIGMGTSMQFMSGTSMATPVVAGIAALMLEKDPTLSPADVKATLRDNADYKTSGSGYTIGTDFHSCWGFGAVNAYDAVNAV